MAISITEASLLKKEIMGRFGTALHFHDGCGGQYFTLEKSNDEITGFIKEYFAAKGRTVTFIANETQFTVGGEDV
ncbi:MAG: hypothetical protein ACI4JI_02865 [Ruminiclostridium sp.]